MRAHFTRRNTFIILTNFIYLRTEYLQLHYLEVFCNLGAANKLVFTAHGKLLYGLLRGQPLIPFPFVTSTICANAAIYINVDFC